MELVLFIILSFLINIIIYSKYFDITKFNKIKLKFKTTKKKKKQSELVQLFEMADFIDFFIMFLQSGSNLYQAFDKTINLNKNLDITNRLSVISNKISSGCSFSEAAQILLLQTNIQIHKDFLETILISAKIGTDLTQNLNVLSEHLRNKAFTKVDEEAAKVPVKMLFPLAFFILPVIFGLLGAGVVKDLISSLSNI